jgi:hypothetical protein
LVLRLLRRQWPWTWEATVNRIKLMFDISMYLCRSSLNECILPDFSILPPFFNRI